MASPGNKMLRNADSDIGGLVQWLGRKCRNHNPLQQMKEQSVSKRSTLTIGMNGQDIYYELGGRCFKINVTEIDAGEVPALQEIGY